MVNFSFPTKLVLSLDNIILAQTKLSSLRRDKPELTTLLSLSRHCSNRVIPPSLAFPFLCRLFSNLLATSPPFPAALVATNPSTHNFSHHGKPKITTFIFKSAIHGVFETYSQCSNFIWHLDSVHSQETTSFHSKSTTINLNQKVDFLATIVDRHFCRLQPLFQWI